MDEHCWQPRGEELRMTCDHRRWMDMECSIRKELMFP